MCAVNSKSNESAESMTSCISDRYYEETLGRAKVARKHKYLAFESLHQQLTIGDMILVESNHC